MKIILSKDFTHEQHILSNKLLLELLDSCHDLEEFSTVRIYGIVLDDDSNKILFSIEYFDPEGEGDTIFCNY